MRAYLDIIQKILDDGIRKENRTGIDTYSISGVNFEHDMSEGFPALTTKKVYIKGVKTELEWFIKGKTDKQWLKDRNNRIWNEWARPDRININGRLEEENIVSTIQNLTTIVDEIETPSKYLDNLKGKVQGIQEILSSNCLYDDLVDPTIDLIQLLSNDLGPVYGFQWRHFGAKYIDHLTDYTGQGFDQLQSVVDKLKTNPTDRRMIVSAWNPLDIPKMGLPPCHYSFQVTVDHDKLNLIWNQRSVDVGLGLPFNIASYGILLHLLAKESDLKEGRLVGNFADTHIYDNHRGILEQQISRTPGTLPTIKTENFTSIFDWEYTDTKLENYKPQAHLKMVVAV